MVAFASYTVKIGRVRIYDGTTPTPNYIEIPFRSTVAGPVDRPRMPEQVVLDRGRHTADSHYVLGPDTPLLEGIPFSLSFRLGDKQPNRSKLLTIIRTPVAGATTKTLPGGVTWRTTKSSTAILNADPLGTAVYTTPPFTDPGKHTVNVQVLWESPVSGSGDDVGVQWAECYFPPDNQITEGELDVMVSLNGEIYGAISSILAFSAGTDVSS